MKLRQPTRNTAVISSRISAGRMNDRHQGHFQASRPRPPGNDTGSVSRDFFGNHGSAAAGLRTGGYPPSTRKRLLLLPFLIGALSACATSDRYDNLNAAQHSLQGAEPQFQVPVSSQDQVTPAVSSGTTFVADGTTLVAGGTTSVAGGTTLVAGGTTIAQWWDSLQDPQLSQLVQSALQHNNDVGIALANLELARTALRDATLNIQPAIDTGINVADQRQANIIGVPGAGARFTTYQAGFGAAWELDVFGRVRHAVDSAGAELDAGTASLDDVYVSVAAEVARTYIELRGAQHRLGVNQRHATNLEQTYQLTQNLLDGGFGDAFDVQRALTQWELVKAAIPNLQAQIDAAINRLSVLTGQMPVTLRSELAAAQPLPSMPPTVNVGEPIDLLKRRPDIRRAEHQLASEVARYKVSVAELYPRVSISGSIGFLATAFAELGSGGTLTHLVGPSISWDVFNRERVNNRVDAQDTRVQAQLENFEKTLLTSFEEVDNAMSALSREGESHANLRAAAEASAQAAALARQRFDIGSYSFLDVLDAQRTQLDAEDLLARSEINLSLNLIALYKALGGGWETSEI
jgi:multidrug efflux system outer membrane protein